MVVNYQEGDTVKVHNKDGSSGIAEVVKHHNTSVSNWTDIPDYLASDTLFSVSANFSRSNMLVFL